MTRDFEPGHKELYSISLPGLPKEADLSASEARADIKTSTASQLDLDFPPLLSTTIAASSHKGLPIIILHMQQYILSRSAGVLQRRRVRACYWNNELRREWCLIVRQPIRRLFIKV